MLPIDLTDPISSSRKGLLPMKRRQCHASRRAMMPVHMVEYAIGVDLGGTNLRAAAIDRSGKLLDKISGSTNFAEGRDAVLDDMVSAIAALRKKHGVEGLAGMGVGVPGFIRMKEGFITSSNNLLYLENFPVRDEISRRLDTRV